MFLFNLIEWVQSLEGVTAITVGGVSIGTIFLAAWSVLKAGKNSETFNKIEGAFKDAKTLIDNLTKTVEEKDQQLLIKEAEQKVKDDEHNATTAFLVKSISLIIAQSNGIQSLDKVALLEEAKDLKDNVIDKSKKILAELKDDAQKAAEILVEQTKEKIEDAKEDVLTEATNVLDKYTKIKK